MDGSHSRALPVKTTSYIPLLSLPKASNLARSFFPACEEFIFRLSTADESVPRAVASEFPLTNPLATARGTDL